MSISLSSNANTSPPFASFTTIAMGDTTAEESGPMCLIMIVLDWLP